jgi:hypothetical protein
MGPQKGPYCFHIYPGPTLALICFLFLMIAAINRVVSFAPARRGQFPEEKRAQGS